MVLVYRQENIFSCHFPQYSNRRASSNVVCPSVEPIAPRYIRSLSAPLDSGPSMPWTPMQMQKQDKIQRHRAEDQQASRAAKMTGEWRDSSVRRELQIPPPNPGAEEHEAKQYQVFRITTSTIPKKIRRKNPAGQSYRHARGQAPTPFTSCLSYSPLVSNARQRKLVLQPSSWPACLRERSRRTNSSCRSTWPCRRRAGRRGRCRCRWEDVHGDVGPQTRARPTPAVVLCPGACRADRAR